MSPRMMIRKASVLALLACACLGSAAAFADSWIPPEEETYGSENGRWRLTVTPRPIGGALDYFRDKVDGVDDAGGLPGAADHAVGQMEHRQGNRWMEAWRGPLVNDVGPVHALVSPTGRAVTFDNWHSMGYGEDAIVIYDLEGKVVRAMGLADFLPEAYVEALPRTVSSIHWGHGHHFSKDARELVVRVVVPGEEGLGRGDGDHVEVRFDLATGAQVPLGGTAWVQALARAERVAALRREEQRQWRTLFVEPLPAPGPDADTTEWHHYLTEAFYRLDPEWEDGFPDKQVIDPRGSAGHGRSVGWLREALVECSQDCVLMVASPSQDTLVEALAAIGGELAPGALQGARVYAVVDDAHAEVALAALAHASPTWIRIDPAQPIPQRKERLEELAERERQ
jgi:hypothetical protein